MLPHTNSNPNLWVDLQLKMLYKTFHTGISDLDESKILQVASNNANVNLLFTKNLAELREQKELLTLLDIGRCGLNVTQNSFKTGAKKGSHWELQNLL